MRYAHHMSNAPHRLVQTRTGRLHLGHAYTGGTIQTVCGVGVSRQSAGAGYVGHAHADDLCGKCYAIGVKDETMALTPEAERILQ